MTKAEVITEIATQTGIEKADVGAALEAFFKVVKNKMSEGDNIYIRGFGSFVNKRRAKKLGRDIAKNTSIVIDEHYVPTFKPSKVFTEKVKRSDRVKFANK